MNAETLLENFEVLAEAPGGIHHIRELILNLAVGGKLVSQEETNEVHLRCEIEGPFQLPDSWRWESITSITSDLGQEVPKSEFQYIDVGSINSKAGRISEEISLLNPEDAPSRARKLVKKGTVLYSTVRPYLRNIAIVEKDFNPKAIASTAFAVLHPSDQILSSYLFVCVRSSYFTQFVESKQKGVAYPAINAGDLKMAMIPLPPIAEQKRIIAKVDGLMALCDQLEQQQKQRNNLRTATRKSAIDAISTATTPEELEAAWKRINNNWEVIADTPESVESLRALVFDLAIRGVLVASDANDRPASELLKQIKDKLGVNSKRSELQPSVVDLGIDLPKIPLHWAWTSIQEIGKVNPRNEAKDDSIAGFVPMASVSANYSTPHQCEPRKWSSIKKGYTHLADGDIAVAKITPCFENGKSCVLSELPNGVGAGTTELLVVRPIIVAPKYILIFLKSSLFYGNGIPRMTGTAGQKRLPTEFFKSCPLPLPPLAEQIRIVAKVNEFMALCDQLESELKSRSEVVEKFARSVVNAA